LRWPDVTTSLYDFLGYLIPGMLTAWVGQVLMVDVFRLPLGLQFGRTETETAFFVVAAFVIGHFVQVVAQRLEPIALNPRVRSGKGWVRLFPSQRFRLESDQHFSTEFKAAFEQKASRVFRIPVGSREAFDLAYTYVITRGYGHHTEVFNAIYGMSRGLIVATLLGAGVYLTQAIDAVTVHEDTDIAREAAILAALLALGSALAFVRARRFSRRFADSVYRAFIAAPEPAGQT